MDLAGIPRLVRISKLVGPQACIRIAKKAEAGIVRFIAAVGRIVEETGCAPGQIVVDLQAGTGRNRGRQAGINRVNTGKFLLLPEERLFENAIDANHLVAVIWSAAVVPIDVVDVLDEP